MTLFEDNNLYYLWSKTQNTSCVQLRETRKSSCIASTRSAVLSRGGTQVSQFQPGGYPILSGYPLNGNGYPHPVGTGIPPDWDWVPPWVRTWDQTPPKEPGTGVTPCGQTDTQEKTTFPTLRLRTVTIYITITTCAPVSVHLEMDSISYHNWFALAAVFLTSAWGFSV